MIQRQYEEKGYVEYEVYDDEDVEDEARAPRPGRRRTRPCVVKQQGGQVKRLN
uniref:Uncharacterized protein n=1 Tax=Arundo donax TaxID=35708 RepID=A0A0A8YGX2_ARUDO